MVCKRCGKEFSVQNHCFKKRNVQYCSAKCYRPENNIEVGCGFCDKRITRQASHARGEILFCNRLCKSQWQKKNYIGRNNPAWKGGWKKYQGADWAVKKEAAKRRDKHTCQKCGSQDNALDVHHITPKSEYEKEDYKTYNQLNNLQTLCHSCHSSTHRQHEWDNGLRGVGEKDNSGKFALSAT